MSPLKVTKSFGVFAVKQDIAKHNSRYDFIKDGMNLNEYMYKQDDHMTLSSASHLVSFICTPTRHYPTPTPPYPLPHPYPTPKLHGVLNERK